MGTKEEGEENLKLTTVRGKSIEFERVEQFSFFGVFLENDGHDDQEIKARIAKRNQNVGRRSNF